MENKKILVMSDSHGRTKNVHKVIEREKSVDYIIHLGDEYNDFLEIKDCYDIKSFGVVGNVDFFIDGPKEQFIEILNKKIFITHGDRYRVKQTVDLIYQKGKNIGADIVLFGHSHKPYIKEDDLCILNPGSISQPRTEKYPSYGIIKISKEDISMKIEYIK